MALRAGTQQANRPTSSISIAEPDVSPRITRLHSVELSRDDPHGRDGDGRTDEGAARY